MFAHVQQIDLVFLDEVEHPGLKLVAALCGAWQEYHLNSLETAKLEHLLELVEGQNALSLRNTIAGGRFAELNRVSLS